MRLTRRLWWTLPLGWLTACAQVLGPQTLAWSEDDLNRMLQKRFPLDRRMLEVLDVNVSQPALRLLPASNRLAVALQVRVLDRVFGGVYQGHIAMESGLRYEPADQTLRLVDVRFGSFSLDEPGRPPRQPLQRLGAVLAEALLDDAVIHRVNPEQLARVARFGYRPDALRITERGMELTVVPAR